MLIGCSQIGQRMANDVRSSELCPSFLLCTLKQHAFANIMSSSSSETGSASHNFGETQAESCAIQPYRLEPRIPANEAQSSSSEEESDKDDDRNLRLENSEDVDNVVFYDFDWRKIFCWPWITFLLTNKVNTAIENILCL